MLHKIQIRQRGEDKYEWFLSHKIQATASLIYNKL